tara:strand:+ start:1668 stop:2075 length:408 start_codon:yes stop_codon:yes gene_type:complete
MRKINKIIVHCSATIEGQSITADTIDQWHKKRGWRGIGYHYVIGLDGLIEYGRMIDEIGAHVKGMNADSIGICYIGGLDADKEAKDTRTLEQKESLLCLLKTLKRLHPDATIHGHREFANKACPCFDANKEYCNI